MADVDPDDPELNEQLKQKIRQRFINQVGPFKIVDSLSHILTKDDIEHIKTCTRNDGNFVGAEELFSRLTQYKGWFNPLVNALVCADLPRVSEKFYQDYKQVLNKLRTTRTDEIHLKEGRGCLSLVDAACRGHVGCILDLLSGETDLNCKNENKESPVYLAAERGHTECLEILIQAGCPLDTPNVNRDTPLFVASKNGFPQCLKTLIEAIERQDAEKGSSVYGRFNRFEILNNDGICPVLAAAAKGHVECLEILLDAGANPRGNTTRESRDGSCFTPLMAATLAGEVDCVQLLLKKTKGKVIMLQDRDSFGRIPIHIAAMEGRVKCMQALIEAGADVDTQTIVPPLCVAAVHRNPECVRLLLSAGADVHRLTKSDGRTPLMIAAMSGDEESLQALIEAGSNLNAQDNNGITALMLAAKSGYDICGQILVENGADIDLSEKSGKTALHYQASSYSLLLTILIDLGADVNTADNLGETPLMVAVRQCDTKSVQYLIMKGADMDKVNASGKTAWMIAQSETSNSQYMKHLFRTKKADTDSPVDSVSDVRVADLTDEPSTKDTDSALPGSRMDFVTLTRRHEMELYIEHEDSLRDRYNDCKKNPGHVGFIPITEFGLSHLPEKYRDQRIFDVIQVEAELTVRLLVKYTSTARPDGYCNSKLRGTRNRRCGSGLITGLYGEFTLQNREKCPCPVCETSGNPKMEWGQLAITTAMHVVYDASEAKETIIHLFVDVDRPDKMHKFYGYDIEECHQGEDRCTFLTATHDLRLYHYLKSMNEQRKEKWHACHSLLNKFVAIVSHPHGCSKQVTVGKWLKRHTEEDPQPWTMDFLPSSYIYNVPTCPGSSGAPVILFTMEKMSTRHPHSGAHQSGKNLSGKSVEEDKLKYPDISSRPGFSRYPKEDKPKFTGKALPKGWWTLFEQEVKRPKSPVQPLYDFQQRPPPS